MTSGENSWPSLGDIDTPEGSVSHHTHLWDAEELKIIDDNENYFYDMLAWLNDLKENGPSGRVEPKKPKPGYKSLLLKNKKKSTKLVGQELHEYLIKNCITSDIATCPLIHQVGIFKSLEDIKVHLISGYQLLKRENSNTIANSIDYGDWLNVSFELHRMEQQSGKVVIPWEKWINENVCIRASYGRKLRKISEVIGKYPRFRTLGLPIYEVYNLINQIKGLLWTNSNASAYWQQTGSVESMHTI